MTKNPNFKTMLNMMTNLQLPIITVELLDEMFYCERTLTNQIIIPSGKDKVTHFTFVRNRGKEGDFLGSVNSLDMCFDDALKHFSKKVLASQGARLTLHAN